MSGKPWVMSSAEVQGSSHYKHGIPCQDKTTRLLKNKVRVIGLADGAGSAALSHFGAETSLACIESYAVDYFDDALNSDEFELKETISSLLIAELSKRAEALDCSLSDLSSTLLMVAVKHNRYFAVHIGDGVIGCLYRDTLQTLSVPANGEYANMTWFTTAKDFDSAIRVYKGDASQISGFVLMSDGPQTSLYDSRSKKLAPAITHLFYENAKGATAPMCLRLEESLRNSIATHTTDDCSIALMSRTRFKNFSEYQKAERKLAKRARKDRIEGAHE
ncbi:PP2C family serine/threonine-protein phosphatase [uncultured Adlercreutzia sp.]|uniref:PP2C family serine/threonine-protein phosphatase n=1 Tax=uncultured Adlercreutzia sp. TaxID=875803 RepID=UPI00258FDA49|nr:PP2C family serine/threonine-protein phosphatase [uncultured Adlercreutzia sp.]